VQKCTDEPRDAVWSMFARSVGQAQAFTDGDKALEEQVRHFKRTLAKHWYSKLGWVDKYDDDPNTKHLRTTALSLSVGGENPEALKKALAMFAKAGTIEALPAEQRALVAGVAVRFGKPEYIDQLMAEYVASNNPEVKDAITAGLCSTRDVKVAERLIKWGINEGGVVRQQDIDHWFAYFMRNYRTRELAWDWLINNWGYLLKLFGGGKHMEYYVWYAAGPLATKEWEVTFKKFFEPKLKDVSLKRNIQIAFGEIAARVAWHDRELKPLKSFLGSAHSKTD